MLLNLIRKGNSSTLLTPPNSSSSSQFAKSNGNLEIRHHMRSTVVWLWQRPRPRGEPESGCCRCRRTAGKPTPLSRRAAAAINRRATLKLCCRAPVKDSCSKLTGIRIRWSVIKGTKKFTRAFGRHYHND